MTFSLLGRCARTGAFGVATTTSGVAVGARVPWAEAGVGAVATQHRTDPRLGPRALALLRMGWAAERALAALVTGAEADDWRQLALMDRKGRTAVWHGARVKPERGHAEGSGCVALGNILASAAVPAAMVRAFAASEAESLPERLLRALEAGLGAGGEHVPVSSAAILVADRGELPLCDLRVDLADDPVAAPRALWRRYERDAELVRRRALDPASCGP